MRIQTALRATFTSGVLLLATAACNAAPKWPAWEGFKQAFVSADGRVIDHSQDDLRTVSEGQAYALFFALIAQDRASFDRILTWTENNLSDGDLGKKLPAWIWGKHKGEWGVIDSNSASDADLWIAYTLLEASRVWCQPTYASKAQQLGQLIVTQELLEVPGLGMSVLPGRVGFSQQDGSVKLNPSYVPPFLMARLAHAWPQEKVWALAYLGSQRLLLDTVQQGFYPDWVVYKNGVYSLPEDEQRGDYDAIRTYLWIGMTHSSDPVQGTLLNLQTPMIRLLESRQNMPEWTQPGNGEVSANAGPEGFQIAMAPLLAALNRNKLAAKMNEQGLREGDAETWRRYGYYNASLTLFAGAYMDNKYRFGPAGQFMPEGKEAKRCG